MKKMNGLKTALTILVITLATSCSKDDDNTSPADSRNVKYEITGNAIGTYNTTYITGSGTGANEIPTSLPWSKEIVVQNSLIPVSFSSAVIGATPGKTITAKIYVGGVVKKAETATVQSDGRAIIAALSYTLK